MSGHSVRLMARADLVEMLSTAVGAEKAEALVHSTCHSLGVFRDPLTESEAHRALASLAEHDGIVGLVAMLAKSRLHFTKAASAPSAES